MDHRRQLASIDLELAQLPDDLSRQGLVYFFQVFEVYFVEGYFEVAEKVADGLQLTSEPVVDEDEGRRLIHTFYLHSINVITTGASIDNR